MNRICGVSIWKGDGTTACQRAGECVTGCTYGCRVGCYNLARFKNPFYNIKIHDAVVEHYWWRYMYSHVEWLCAECYDDMIKEGRYFEEIMSDLDNFVEDHEFTKIMKTL